MPIDHDFIRTHETDPSGKKVGNARYTDPDGNEVYLQKVVVGDPEDGTATGLMEVNNGRGQVDAVVTGSVTANAGTNLNTSALLTESDFDTRTGSLTETAPATDTASSGLNGRLQRIAQRLTSLIALLPTSLGAGGGLKVDGSGTALPVSGTVTATATNLDIRDLTSASDGVSMRAEVSADVTATWDNATANGSAVQIEVDGYSLVVIQILGDGDFDGGGGTIRFQGSADGGTSWVFVDTLQFWTTTAVVTESLASYDGGAWGAFRSDVAGLTHFRVYLQTNTISAGTLAVTLRATAGKAPYALVLNFDELLLSVGSVDDAAATGDGSLNAILKRLRTLLNGGLPAALAAGGGLKVEGVAGGVAQPVSGTVTAAQATAANLNMTEASAATIATNTGNAATSLSVLDDWDESDRAKVNPIAGQAGVQGGSGAVSNTTQRVVLATDVALPAGTNAIGKLAANSGVDIGDVDVTSVPADPFGANADAAGAAGAAGSISAKLRSISRDLVANIVLAAGTNNIGDVDVLTVPADPFGANADAASATGSISAKLRFIAATGIPVTSVPSHAVTNAGTFATQVDGAALTALQLIDDPVVQDDAGFTPGTTKVMMAGFEADESSTDSVDEGDGGAARMTLDRKQIVTVQPHTAGGLSTFMASGSDGSSILVATKQTIKNSAGQLYGWYFYNPESAVTFVHVYNTDTVTVGTTNPQQTFAIPPLSAVNAFAPQGIAFSTAMSTAATTTAGGNTAPATGVSAVFYYA